MRLQWKQFKNIALPNANFVEWNDGEIHVSYSMKSNEIMWKAAAAQRRKLKNNDYLKSITAFDYLKKLKRVQDFEDYADEIVAKINAG